MKFGKKNKYGAIKVSHAGYSFGSKLEAATFQILKLMEHAGSIRDIKCQQSVYLTDARIQYIADFSAINTVSLETLYYESKGFSTAVWAIKKRLWKHYGPGPLFIFTGSHLNPKMTEEIYPVKNSLPCEKCGHSLKP
jgi:hypothetical protein